MLEALFSNWQKDPATARADEFSSPNNNDSLIPKILKVLERLGNFE